MNRENKKLIKELNDLKKNRSQMDKIVYAQEVKKLVLKIKDSMAREIEVDYEEVKIIDSVNNIIRS